jgi:hypothetical protein
LREELDDERVIRILPQAHVMTPSAAS